MPESPSSSFIPKRGSGKKPASARKSNFILISIVSYALFVSAPLASAAVFIYERHTQNQFNKAVVALDQAIVSFKEADLSRVIDFDDRLSLSRLLLSSHVSINTLLTAIENSTAKNIKFKALDITRKDKSMLEVQGLVSATGFDGVLFQRSSYGAADIINTPLFTDVKLVQAQTDDSASTAILEKSVEFKVAFNFNVSNILYKTTADSAVSSPTITTTSTTSTTSETSL